MSTLALQLQPSPAVSSRSRREPAPRRQPDLEEVAAWAAAHVERMTPEQFREWLEQRRRSR